MKTEIIFLLWPVILFVGSFLGSFFFPFIYWPEMLNWPFFLSSGWLPYRDFTTIHTPLLPLLLMGVYKILGFTPWVLRLVGAMLLATSAYLVARLAFSFSKDRGVALVAGSLFSFLALSFEGNTVWFENLLTPLFLLAFWLQIGFWKNGDRRKIWLSGLVFAFSFLVKQTTIYLLPEFLIFLLLLRLRKRISWGGIGRTSFIFISPILGVVAIFIVVLERLEILGDFYFWAVRFPFFLPLMQAENLEPDLLLPNLRQIGILGILLGSSLWAALQRPTFPKLLLYGWLLLSLFFIFPRFAYWHLLPFLSIFSILISVGFFSGKGKRLVGVVVLSVIMVATLPVLENTLVIGQRFLTEETSEIASWIQENYPSERIYSLNGPDIVYFLTGKMPAVRPWIDQLPWEMAYFGEERYLAAFIKGRPDVVIFRSYLPKPVEGLGAYRPKKVVEYFFAHYQKVKEFAGGASIWQKIAD